MYKEYSFVSLVLIVLISLSITLPAYTLHVKHRVVNDNVILNGNILSYPNIKVTTGKALKPPTSLTIALVCLVISFIVMVGMFVTTLITDDVSIVPLFAIAFLSVGLLTFMSGIALSSMQGNREEESDTIHISKNVFDNPGVFMILLALCMCMIGIRMCMSSNR